MLTLMVLAHLLGDYLFQTNAIVRWKTRSLLGVVAHGVIVTLTAIACAALADPSWWPYALLIGVSHTAMDVVRARFVRPAHSTWEWILYLLDQAGHLLVIFLVVTWSSGPGIAELSASARFLADPRLLAFIIGYLLLMHPAWVFLRFTARGVWGPAVPHLGEGEKYGPMVERVLIATCVLLGQFTLVPLVLLPRRLTPIRIQGQGVGVLVRPTGHWAETILSALSAAAVGWALRIIIAGA